jgi:aspartyl-tRNA(Asn)/glutamyl-tRNA(Gln) amidotransferase subunit C
MAVSTTDVTKIAELARLHIDEERLPTFVAQLNTILGHMEVLQKVDTSNVPNIPNNVTSMPLREDKVDPAPMRLSADGLTADARDGFILVPRLSTHEDV